MLGLLLIVMDSKEVMVGMSPISTDALNSKSRPLVVLTATRKAAIGAPSSRVGSILLLGGLIAYGRSI